MLFLGNSYTFQNELDQAVAAVFESAGEDVAATRLANAGWRFVDHLSEVETPGSVHATAFSEAHDWVILQEQSQIPGFPEDNGELLASRDAAVALDGYAAATGGETMFLMTWGRRAGDLDNLGLYPDFLTMQDALADGYYAYVAAASADGGQAWLAPAGLAWQHVYDDVVAAGEDPLVDGSPFWELYVDDGSHPSQRGTYLAACVIYTSITGRSPEGLDAPGNVADAAYLQSVAASVVLEGEGIVYPWTGGESGDTGVSEDTVAKDIATVGPGGCGCNTGGVGGGWVVGLFGVFALRRRGR